MFGLILRSFFWACFLCVAMPDFEDIKLDFCNIHYLKKVRILSYFSQPINLERLERFLDKSNGILEKTIKLIETNKEINIQYKLNENFYKNLFPFEKDPKIITSFVIENKEIKSSIGQLNFIMWLFENDYLLHIE